MKKEIENKNDAKEKIRKHLSSLAVKKGPYASDTANKKFHPTQKPRG